MMSSKRYVVFTRPSHLAIAGGYILECSVRAKSNGKFTLTPALHVKNAHKQLQTSESSSSLQIHGNNKQHQAFCTLRSTMKGTKYNSLVNIQSNVSSHRSLA
jgi:hypothetical protein